MGRLLEELRKVKTLEEALNLINQICNQITLDDVIEVGTLSDTLLESDPTRAQAFAEIVIKASECVRSWELHLRGMISKANALIVKGDREEAKRLLMEVICESISWFRTDLVAIAMNNLSKMLDDKEQSMRYKEAAEKILKSLQLEDIVSGVNSLIPGFHQKTFKISRPIQPPLRPISRPTPLTKKARPPTLRFKREISPTGTIMVTIPENWTVNFIPNPMGPFEDGCIISDPNNEHSIVRTSTLAYLEPNSPSVTMFMGMTGMSPTMFGVKVRPYVPPAQLINEFLGSTVSAEKIEPISEVKVGSEPCPGAIGGVAEKATLEFKGVTQGKEVRGTITVYCARFKYPSVMGWGQDTEWKTYAVIYYSTDLTPKVEGLLKTIINSIKLNENKIRQIMMRRLRRR